MHGLLHDQTGRICVKWNTTEHVAGPMSRHDLQGIEKGRRVGQDRGVDGEGWTLDGIQTWSGSDPGPESGLKAQSQRFGYRLETVADIFPECITRLESALSTERHWSRS
jgi:hypothetical protein